jgi:hypothetical protein
MIRIGSLMLSLAYGFCNANIGPLQEKARSSRAGDRIGKSCRFVAPVIRAKYI